MMSDFLTGQRQLHNELICLDVVQPCVHVIKVRTLVCFVSNLHNRAFDEFESDFNIGRPCGSDRG
jgi:hypothetical protein